MTEARLASQRKRRLLSNNKVTKKYEKTVNGFLMRTYRNMKSRVTGVQYLKSHLYLGKELLDKQLFYEWSLINQDFINLYIIWKDSNFERKLTPSIDRRNPKEGYHLDNMRWITHSENSRLGSLSRFSNVNLI